MRALETQTALAVHRDLNNPDRDAAATLFSDSEWRLISRVNGLTPRQEQVARMLCDGATYQAIAYRAKISINTVRLHVRCLFRRLGVHDRVSLILRLVACYRNLIQDGARDVAGRKGRGACVGPT